MDAIKKDDSGRAFLLSYIEFQKNELLNLQVQLNRYAQDFSSLLAASSDQSGASGSPSSPRQKLPEHEMVRFCVNLARRAGCDDEYCGQFGEAVAAVLHVAKAGSPVNRQVSSMAIEIVMFRGKWFNGKGSVMGVHGDAIPLSARIFCLAEYIHSLMQCDLPGAARQAVSQTELALLLTKFKGRIFDPGLVDLVLAMAENELPKCGSCA